LQHRHRRLSCTGEASPAPRRVFSRSQTSTWEWFKAAVASCLWCVAQPTELAQPFAPRLTSTMKGRAVFVLFGLRTLGAYALGYRSALRPGARHGDSFAVRFCSTRPSQRVRQRSSPSRPRPTRHERTGAIRKGWFARRKTISKRCQAQGRGRAHGHRLAAIIVQASRAQYHAGGRPCACPDDTMRNGRACGGRSAYSRPGGASPGRQRAA
jgi:hypothetical protein